MDSLDKKERSLLMGSVKKRDTAPELAVRGAIRKLGHSFKLHSSELPGSPDIVLPPLKTALFVNGCFWHQHPACPRSKRPKSHPAYWNKKLDANIRRDRAVNRKLRAMGWRVLVVWGCETQDEEALARQLLRKFTAAQKIKGV
jgi:DNA mismatch endonuclease (patch repair protein)